MAWRLAGTFVASCSCKLICPCAVDGPPTGPDGKCHGTIVFNVREGNLDGQDLSGSTLAMYFFIPKTLSAGDLKLGVIVDESASDEQVQALERIFKGDEGGQFADFAALTSEWLGAQRGSVSFSDGDTPSAELAGASINFEPLKDAQGTTTTVKNAMFGFAPEFKIGKSSGRVEAFGDQWESVYGESADFEYAS
jgi:hypothetical protein